MNLSEVIQSIERNRKKSIIAGISVLWGIMLLVILSGTGNGLQNGIEKIFSIFNLKTIQVFGGEASISSAGIARYETVNFSDIDLVLLKKKFKEINYISSVVRVNLSKIRSEKKTAKRFELIGVNEGYFNINRPKLNYGRFFNPYDEEKNYTIIGNEIAKSLFNGNDCLGKIVFIKNTGYKVIGVISDDGLLNNTEFKIFVPSEKAKELQGFLSFNEFVLSIGNEENTERFQKTIKSYFSRIKGYNPNDKTTLFFDNVESTIKSFNTIFRMINIFLWFIAITFLISGALGVFNVMTVIVNDRIGEFGIRKAFGATPSSILQMVILESLLITIVSGIIGLIVGLIVLKLINVFISTIEDFKNLLILDVNIYIIFLSLLLLVLTGCIAGIVPARKASKTLPINALRELN